MSIDNNPIHQAATFDILPPFEMGKETDMAKLGKQVEEGKLFGNAAFADTIANAKDPETIMNIIREFNLPMQEGESPEAFVKRILKDLQSDDPQIVPDSELMSSADPGAINAATMADLAEAQALFGAQFVKEMMAQGRDAKEFAEKIQGVLVSLSTPLSDLPEDVRQELLLQMALSEGDENHPVTFTNPAAKSLFTKVRTQLKREVEQSGTGSSGDPSRLLKQPSNIQQAELLYGKEFVQRALASGKDPLAFITDANNAMTGLTFEPPISKMSRAEKSRILFQLLLAQTADEKAMQDPMVSRIVSKMRQQAVETAAKTASTQAADKVSESVSSAVNIIGRGNPWLEATPLVAFATAFLTLIRKLMKNKLIEGQMEISTMNMTMTFARVAQAFEKKLGELTQANALMGVAAGAAGMAVGVAGTKLSAKARAKEQTVPTEPKFVPVGNTPAARQNAELANQGKLPQQTASREKVQKAKTQEELATQEQTAAQAKVDQNRAEGKTDAASQDQYKLDDKRLAEASQKKKDAMDDRVKAEQEASDLDQTLGVRKQTPQEFAAEKRQVEAQNRLHANEASKGQMMTHSGAQISTMATNIMTAATALEEAQVKGEQHVVQSLLQLIQNVLSKVTAQIAANSDNIAAFLSALKELQQAIARAMTELVK